MRRIKSYHKTNKTIVDPYNIMKIKQWLIIALLAIAHNCLGQGTLAQKDSIAKLLVPIEDKAIVYIIRPTTFGAIIRMNVECDSVHIGSTTAKRYIYTALSPGKHTLFSRSENKSTLEVELEAGKIYYINQQVKMGFFIAETGLMLLNEEDGKKYLNKCKLSKDNTYSN